MKTYQESTSNENLDSYAKEHSQYDPVKVKILEELRNQDPDYFKRLVLVLLEKMECENIYATAKHRENVVSENDMKKFVNKVLEHPVEKGLFITTSSFSKEARFYAQSVPNLEIILIDGYKLCDLMFEYKVGFY